MTFASQDRLVSVRDTAAMLGCSVATVWRKVSEGSFPQPMKIGGMTRWSETELLSFIDDAKQTREAA
ncbi:MAG: helix-turn-helix domain-containing protein [Pseudomonadota bacterium]